MSIVPRVRLVSKVRVSGEGGGRSMRPWTDLELNNNKAHTHSQGPQDNKKHYDGEYFIVI